MPRTHLPVIGISGAAGAGKDTVAEYLRDQYGATTIALADPMKRFARYVFGFSIEQLWGPSEARSAPDPMLYWRRDYVREHFDQRRYFGENEDASLPYALSSDGRLRSWFDEIMSQITPDCVVSPRIVLQTLGTNWGRVVDQQLWIDLAIKYAINCLTGMISYSQHDGPSPANGTNPVPFVVIPDVRFFNEIVRLKSIGASVMKIVRPTTGDTNAAFRQHESEKSGEIVPKHWFDTTIHNVDDIQKLKMYVRMTMSDMFNVAPRTI